MISENKFVYALWLADSADVGVKFSKEEAQELARMIDGYLARIAELENQVWDLNLANEKLESAYFADETIAPDGTLKPSVRKLLERLEKANTNYDMAESHVTALLNRIAKLEAERRWIPVSERLPEMNVRVLISSSGYVSTDFLRVKTYPRFRFEGSVYPVTHWMPLPEPPEVENV